MSAHARAIVGNLLSDQNIDPLLIRRWLTQDKDVGPNITAIAGLLAQHKCRSESERAADQLQNAIDGTSYGNKYNVMQMLSLDASFVDNNTSSSDQNNGAVLVSHNSVGGDPVVVANPTFADEWDACDFPLGGP